MKLSRLAVSFAVSVLAAGALAHDFWIEPSSFRADKGSIVKVDLLVGDFAAGERVPRTDARIVDFSARCAGSSKPIVGRDGADPAGFVRLESEGVHVLGYRSTHASVELEPAKFESYLREKGLDSVRDERARLGESSSRVRELYSRCAKSIVRVGDGPAKGFDAMLGYPLELIPEKNPGELARNGASALELLPVRLFYDGKPLANALVGALDLDAPAPTDGSHQQPIEVRTDAEGRAVIPLPHAGRWLLAAVHMVRAKDAATADWESFWASLTFEVRRG